ncbi:MAG: DUF2085 domain-containing protein [Bacteroidetes bacterium]|nr:DUF2085 domain-containing protein [Bacteroidota bacterium]
MTAQINWLGWIGAWLLMAVLPITVSLTPWISEPLRYVLMEAFHIFCHQIPERSPHVNGVQLAVCDRCYGILIGLCSGPLMALFYWKWIARHARMMIIVSIVPLVIDWGFGIVGVLSNTPESRFVTGFLFGIVAGGLVAHGMSFRKHEQ